MMTANPSSAAHFLEASKHRIEKALANTLPSLNTPSSLPKALHYAVLNGGKRLRPALVYAVGHCLMADEESLDIPAMAVELIHCYSLVHDDLPAMDNDDLRRGKPTCHKAFDEATAILVGDALQSLAFELLATEQDSPSRSLQLQMIKTLAKASGVDGMVGGQALDMHAEHKTLDVLQLETLHRLKTGALIQAAVKLGALTAGCEDEATLQALDRYAGYLGLAFQIQDDILDIESTTEELGKKTGADLQQHKSTYPQLLGLQASKEKQEYCLKQAILALKPICENTDMLKELANHLLHRRF